MLVHFWKSSLKWYYVCKCDIKENSFFIVSSLNGSQYDNTFYRLPCFVSQIVLYFLPSTSVLSFYIGVVLALCIFINDLNWTLNFWRGCVIINHYFCVITPTVLYLIALPMFIYYIFKIKYQIGNVLELKKYMSNYINILFTHNLTTVSARAWKDNYVP